MEPRNSKEGTSEEEISNSFAQRQPQDHAAESLNRSMVCPDFDASQITILETSLAYVGAQHSNEGARTRATERDLCQELVHEFHTSGNLIASMQRVARRHESDSATECDAEALKITEAFKSIVKCYQRFCK